jgi:phospholipid-transporting ATPase
MVISLEIAKIYQAVFMARDQAMPGAATPSQALNDDLGQVGYVLSDKTGTLTSNELVLKVATVDGVIYPDLAALRNAMDQEPKNEMVNLFVDAMSVCHDIAPNFSNPAHDDNNNNTMMKKRTKNSIGDLKSIAIAEKVSRSSTHTTDTAISYCGESPDEICLVTACAKYLGRTMTKRSQSGIVIEDRRWGVVRVNNFDNARRRSSVVVSHPDFSDNGDTLFVFVKGSDDAMMPCCVFESESDVKKRDLTQKMINQYAKSSLRTLVFGFKKISRAELQLAGSINQLEANLTLLGCTGTEDRLQDGVPGSIERLRIAGIAVWMITGDKLDTAVEISKSANLISPIMQLVTIDISDEEEVDAALTRLNAAISCPVAAVVTGRSIRHLVHADEKGFISLLLRCSSVVVCRSTKDQKAQMVSLIQKVVKNQVLVLAIGDGANDVPMIKKADVGVGIAGKEGRQAAQNADYVISQFQHLERLLLFHGRLNYVRTSKMVLYFLFKNLALAFPFAIHTVISSLYSSSVLVSSTVGMSFNTVLTCLPVFVLGLLERDVSPNDRLVSFGSISAPALAQAYPKLYMTGRQNRMFTRRLLGSVFIAALLVGTWVYTICLLPLSGLFSSNCDGKMLDQWSVSLAYFVGIFTVDTAAAVLISEGLTTPMVMAIGFSAFACATFLVSDGFDASSPVGLSFWLLLTETWIGIPVLLLAFIPPILVGVGVKSWKYRFDPTARMVWQEAKQRADRRRAALKKMEESPNFRSQIARRNQSVINIDHSCFYHPEQIENSPLIPQ